MKVIKKIEFTDVDVNAIEKTLQIFGTLSDIIDNNYYSTDILEILELIAKKDAESLKFDYFENFDIEFN